MAACINPISTYSGRLPHVPVTETKSHPDGTDTGAWAHRRCLKPGDGVKSPSFGSVMCALVECTFSAGVG